MESPLCGPVRITASVLFGKILFAAADQFAHIPACSIRTMLTLSAWPPSATWLCHVPRIALGTCEEVKVLLPAYSVRQSRFGLSCPSQQHGVVNGDGRRVGKGLQRLDVGFGDGRLGEFVVDDQ